MVRIVIDIEEYGDFMATKETVAMALEHFGKIRVVQVIDGREEVRKRTGKTRRDLPGGFLKVLRFDYFRGFE